MTQEHWYQYQGNQVLVKCFRVTLR